MRSMVCSKVRLTGAATSTFVAARFASKRICASAINRASSAGIGTSSGGVLISVQSFHFQRRSVLGGGILLLARQVTGHLPRGQSADPAFDRFAVIRPTAALALVEKPFGVGVRDSRLGAVQFYFCQSGFGFQPGTFTSVPSIPFSSFLPSFWGGWRVVVGRFRWIRRAPGGHFTGSKPTDAR